MAVTCGDGAGSNDAAGENDSMAEAVATEICAVLCLGLTAYAIIAAPTPMAKRMVSMVSYTISIYLVSQTHRDNF